VRSASRPGVAARNGLDIFPVLTTPPPQVVSRETLARQGEDCRCAEGTVTTADTSILIFGCAFVTRGSTLPRAALALGSSLQVCHACALDLGLEARQLRSCPNMGACGLC